MIIIAFNIFEYLLWSRIEQSLILKNIWILVWNSKSMLVAFLYWEMFGKQRITNHDLLQIVKALLISTNIQFSIMRLNIVFVCLELALGMFSIFMQRNFAYQNEIRPHRLLPSINADIETVMSESSPLWKMWMHILEINRPIWMPSWRCTGVLGISLWKLFLVIFMAFYVFEYLLWSITQKELISISFPGKPWCTYIARISWFSSSFICFSFSFENFSSKCIDVLNSFNCNPISGVTKWRARWFPFHWIKLYKIIGISIFGTANTSKWYFRIMISSKRIDIV